MNLSALLVTYHLRKKYDVKSSDWLSREPHLKYAVCHAPSRPMDKDMIYIVDTPRYTMPIRNLSRILVIFTGHDFGDIHKEYANVCVLPPSVSALEILGFLLELFHIYASWNQSLTESRLNNSSIQELLDLTDPIIPNPMLVIRTDFTIIASKKTQYGELKNSVLGASEDTLDLINSLKGDLIYGETFFRTGYYFYPGNEIASPQLCVNIAKSGKTAYRLMMGIGEAPLDDTFGFILEYLAKLVSHGLSENDVQDRNSAHTLRQVFHTLLTNPGADYVEVSRLLSAAGWLSSHYYQCILIQISILDVRNLTLNSICNYVENMIPESCAVEYRGNAVIYIDLDLCSLTEDEINQKMATFIRDSLLIASYSRKLLGHFNFHRQYVQASLTLELGKRKHPSRWIHHFNDIAMPFLMEQATKKLPAYMICHEKLLYLKNMSEAGHSHLYETFRCYLENHLNVTKTAEALFIHRSTLLYRLEKIRGIMRTDLDNPQEMLYLLLSFHLMDMEE